MTRRAPTKRSYGSGSLFAHRDARGQETWYGKFRAGGRQVKRRIGPKRPAGSREGLTRAQAERELRRLLEGELKVVPQHGRVTVSEAGECYLGHLESLGRKRSTLQDYASTLRVHLAPFLGGTTLDKIDADLVEAFVAEKRRQGRAPKSVRNYLGFLLHLQLRRPAGLVRW